MKGISNERACKCKDHEFILRPLAQNLHHSKKVQICLCQEVSKNGRNKVFASRRKCTAGFPTMNKDKNYATPAFILQSQKEHFLENRNIYLKDHSRKAKQYEQVATDLYFPAPRSNYDYCNVCCTSYTDYIQHISSFEHLKQIKMTKFNTYILELEQTFKIKDIQESPKRSMQQRYIQIDDDSDFSSSGNKKLKNDEKTQPNQNIQIFSQNALPQFKNYYQFNNYMYVDPIMNCKKNLHTQEKVNLTQQIKPLNHESSNYMNLEQFYQNQLNILINKYYFNQQSHHYYPIQTNYSNNVYQYSQAAQQYIHHNAYQDTNQPYVQSMNKNGNRYGQIHGNYNYFFPYQQYPLLYLNNLSIFGW